MKIEISEIIQIKARLGEINLCDFDAIEWIRSDGTRFEPSEELKEEFKATGLSNKDFVDFLTSDDIYPGKETPKGQLIQSGTHKGKRIIVRGHFETVYGSGWRNIGSTETMNYGMRYFKDELPDDNEVYVGEIGQMTVLVHKSELEES